MLRPEPTQFDRASAAIAFQRPVGNHSNDELRDRPTESIGWLRWSLMMSVFQHGYPASRHVLLDLILSFAVYVVPLITIHALVPAGLYLMLSILRLEESPVWVALDWTAILLVQGMVFGLLRAARRLRTIGRTILRVGALAAAVPAVNVLLLWVIPVSYLVEESTAAEVNHLTEVCHVGGITIPPGVGFRGALHLDGSAAVLPVWHGPNRQPALLHVDGCRIEDLDIPPDPDGTVSPSGAWKWRPREAALTAAQSGQDQWFLTTPSGVTLAPITTASSHSPHILNDGSGLFWLETVPVEPADDDVAPRIVVVTEEGTRHVEGAGVPRGTDRVLEGDGPAGPFHFRDSYAYDERWLTIDEHGQVTRSISAPADNAPNGHHLRPLTNGLIAWDTYRDLGGRYVVTWNTDGRAGTRTLSKGLRFDNVAFDERGEYIAISASSASRRIGNQRAEVWLVRTSDGVELFRRYTPTFFASGVALPSGRYFAVDEVHDRRSAVRVYDLKSSR